MRHEHVVTYKEKISMKNLEYLVKKSNKLGRLGKEIVGVYQQEDEEGFHLYFEVTGMSYVKEGD